MTPLSNGNYVVCSPRWDNGAISNVGAVTWGNGTSGTTGPVTPGNSLVGTMSGDLSGSEWACVTALGNGHYVVQWPYWDNGAIVDAGAVTWGNGATGTSGVVSAANSLVGTSAHDRVGCCWPGTWALSNGNYVVVSYGWDNGAVPDVGAVTWGNGTTGTIGPVSTANSLIGSTPGDRVGSGEHKYTIVSALSDGNYVVRSPLWDNGAVVDAGAATWGNGTTGTVAVVSAANSLVGSTGGDQVGSYYVTVLSNGNYVVSSPLWDNGAVSDAGAVTWGNGMSGTSGPVSSANSLVGSTAGDQVGRDYTPMYALSNGDYVLGSPYWDNGAIVDAGAVTWGNGTTGTTGPITADNSVRGTAAGGGSSMSWWGGYDIVNHQLVVGRPADNIVTLFRLLALDYSVFLPVILKNAP